MSVAARTMPGSAVRVSRPLQRLAHCRKAMVSGLGAVAAVAVSVKDPLGSVLPAGATAWIAVGMAVVTAIATYLTTNTERGAVAMTPDVQGESVARGSVKDTPPDIAEQPPAASAVYAGLPASQLAGLALMAGGMLWTAHRRGRTREPVLGVMMSPDEVGRWLPWPIPDLR